MNRFLVKTMKVISVKVRHDNYAYLLVDSVSSNAAVVDPFDVNAVKVAANTLGLNIVACLTTHHHHDHSGGNKDFATSHPTAPIYGGSDKVAAVTHIVKDKDEFKVGENVSVKCLATPCHTKDSICYYVTDTSDSSQPGGVFTGDTLFLAGCGRFFQGTASEMHAALSYLGSLPDKTIVYNGHEYTASNVSFAKFVDPENPAVRRLEDIAENNQVTTGLTTIGDEKSWNPFMRLHTDAIRKAVGAAEGSSEVDVMRELREMKNNFKG